MAWPPPIPPNTRQNVTPELDNHPSDHNFISNALTEISSRVILDSGGFYGSLINIPGTVTDLITVTIAPATVASRLILNGAFWLSSNAQWGVQLDVTNLANTSLLSLPVAFVPSAMGNTYYMGYPTNFALDLTANAVPSFKYRAVTTAGGGTQSGRAIGMWMLVAR